MPFGAYKTGKPVRAHASLHDLAGKGLFPLFSLFSIAILYQDRQMTATCFDDREHPCPLLTSRSLPSWQTKKRHGLKDMWRIICTQNVRKGSQIDKTALYGKKPAKGQTMSCLNPSYALPEIFPESGIPADIQKPLLPASRRLCPSSSPWRHLSPFFEFCCAFFATLLHITAHSFAFL